MSATFKTYLDSNGYILYWSPPVLHELNSSKILGMDLDWTIIKPIKGKIFPIDENDWEFINNKISQIKMYISRGYKFVIFTNQLGLLTGKRGQITIEQFKTRWNDIYNAFKTTYNIESVYLIVSLYDDFYRKPAPYMWEFVENHLNNNIKVNRDVSVYVGDMAGRKGDYAYTDLMFALNLGVPFMVPEVFYGDATGKLSSNQTPKLIKDLEKDHKIFNAGKYLKDDKEISKNHKINYETIKMIKKYLEVKLENRNVKILILYVGSPASGKSNFLTNYLPDFKKQINYMSQDTFDGTPAKFIKTISQYMDGNTDIGNIIVIDNTNGTIKTREKYISLAHNKGYKVMGIYFDTPKEICMHLNALRTKINNIYTELKTIPRSNKNKNDKDKDDEDYNLDVKDDNVKDDIVKDDIVKDDIVKDDIVKDDNKTDSDGNSNVPAVAIHTYWKKLEKPNKINENIDELFTIHFETIFPEIGTKNGITKERFQLLL